MTKKNHKTIMMRSVMKHKPFWGILLEEKRFFSKSNGNILKEKKKAILQLESCNFLRQQL